MQRATIPGRELRARWPLLVAGAAVLAPWVVLIVQLAEHGTGFLVQDDWNVYVTSFDWLLRGDLTVLWASVSEHRVVLSRVLHFLQYTLVGDTRALLFFSPALQLVFAVIALRRLSIDHPFSSGGPGTALRTCAWFVFSALLFSPIQAWAYARTAYLEIFALNLGALVFLLGLTRWRVGLALGGLLLAVCSTPGWLALIPTALVFFLYSSFIASDAPTIRRQLRCAVPVLLVAGLLAMVYVLPFDHPNNSGAGHAPMSRLVPYLFSHLAHVLGHYLAFLGFPIAVVSASVSPSADVTPAEMIESSRVFGLVYLAFGGLLAARLLRARRSVDLASLYVLFTLGLSLSIAVARTPILGQHAVVNYAYSAYVVPGWALALYLWFRWFDDGLRSFTLPVLRNIAAAFALALILVGSSYQRGRVALLGTLHGQKYLLSLYVRDFLSPSSAEAKWESARILDHPDPERVFEGTAILVEHELVPRNWR